MYKVLKTLLSISQKESHFLKDFLLVVASTREDSRVLP